MNVLEIKNLNVKFDVMNKECYAVDGISLEINEGEIVALVGESGCGKSLTAAATLGLTPESAMVSGDIIIDGKSLGGASAKQWDAERGQTVTMVFQEPMTALNPLMKVGRQISEHVKDRSIAKERALELLELVGLPDPERIYASYPHTLSGGQRQRIMIAMSLINLPKLLVADEPTTALDVTVQAQILELVEKLCRSTGTSVLFITHDLGVVNRICDRVYVMYAGRIVESGKTSDVLLNPQHPYTKGLVRSIPDISMRGMDFYTIKGSVPALYDRERKSCIFCNRCELCTDICTHTVPTLTTYDGRLVACHNIGGHRHE